MKHWLSSPLFLLCALLCLAGCQEKHAYSSLKSSYKVEGARRFGVALFQNLTPNRQAGQDVSGYCYNELFRLVYEGQLAPVGLPFEVLDENLMSEAMTQVKWEDQINNTASLRQLAKASECHMVLMGTVSEYHYKRGLGEDPVVSLHLRMYDAESDTVMWSGSYSKTGRFSWFREDALGRLGQEVSRELLGKLKEALLQRFLHE
ncbi:MAG: hypothetical protein HQL31_00220 [Planctomycetes bacterium]|nr:hypothetical protein [Planctomycetota bacterium]